MAEASQPNGGGLERLMLLLLLASAALVAVTCGSEGTFGAKVQTPPRPTSAEPPPVDSSASAETAKNAGADAGRADDGPGGRSAAAGTEMPQLARFFGALSELEHERRREPVRIFWLGDSHTAADFWTGVVRRSFAQRFGAGGPGFVRAGTQAYRHDQVKLGCEGRFRIQPTPPARRAPQGDGVFGLGGMRVLPEVGARTTLEVDPRTLVGRARFELWFRLVPGASLRIDLGKQALAVDHSTPVERVSGSPIARLRLEGSPGEQLSITATSGAPELYGVVAEGSEPGVVLDTSGIDGARLATPLAWAEEPFVAELSARAPALYAVAYGTNEAFDALRVDRYADQLKSLIGRLRRGAPQADCLVIGPPDAAARGGGSEPRVAEIRRVLQRTAAEIGCAYLSAFELMGGEGSFERFMRETPRLARPDRIHLTPKGYEKLGEATARELLRAYEAFVAGRP